MVTKETERAEEKRTKALAKFAFLSLRREAEEPEGSESGDEDDDDQGSEPRQLHSLA